MTMTLATQRPLARTLIVRRWGFATASVAALATVALAPLPYGGIYTSWLMLLVALSAVILGALVALAGRARGPELRVVLLAGAFPATVLLLNLLQQSSLLPTSPVWSDLPIVVDPLPTSTRGVGQVETAQALLFALLVLCGHMVARGGFALRILRALAYAGAFYALIALGYEFVAPDRLLLTEKRAYLGDLTTPFVNRNTAATFYGSCALILTAFVARARLGRSSRLAATGDVAALVLTFAALGLTGSRAGIALSLLAMAAAYLGSTRGYLRAGSGRTPWLLLAALPVLMVLVVLSERFADDGIAGGGRIETYALSLQLVAERPLTGWGLGTFPHVFPSVRDGAIRGIWDRAHSTPLEWAVEGGVPFALALLFVLSAIGWRCLVLFRQAREPYHGATQRERGLALRPLCAFLVLGLALAHSTLDFSFDITGYLAFCAFVTGLGTSSVPSAASPSLRN